MKYVEVRRHSQRDHEGNLSPQGRELATRATRTLGGPFQAYYSSSKARAIQTIEVMGGSDIRIDDRFGLAYVDRVTPHEGTARQVMGERGLSLVDAYLAVPEIREVLRDTARDVLAAVLEIAAELPEGGRALVGSHGGTIEPAVLLALGQFDPGALGPPFAECEGARFLIGEGRVVGVEILRQAPA